MLMKLGHRDITETNPDGIDHRANTVFYASDKHSIKCYKKGAKKNHSHIVFCFFSFRCSSHVSPSSSVYCIHRSFIFSLVRHQMWRRGAWNWPGVCCVVVRITKASPPIMHWSCYCIPGHLIRSCWYHRRCHQPFQALNRWFPLFLRSCQCPLCGSWENDLTHRQLLSAAWVILYSHFYWRGLGGGGLSRTYHCKQGVRPQ